MPVRDAPVSNKEVERIVKGLASTDREQVVENVRSADKAFCNCLGPMEKFVSLDGVAKLVDVLHWNRSPDIQVAAVRCLVNISNARTEWAHRVVEAGALKPLLELLESPHVNVMLCAVFALDRIASSDPIFRDMLIGEGAIREVAQLVDTNTPEVLLVTVAACLRNLCQNALPRNSFEVVMECLPTLKLLLGPLTSIRSESRHHRILQDVCWTLRYFTPFGVRLLEEVIDESGIDRLIEIASTCTEREAALPALLVLEDIVADSPDTCEMFLGLKGVPRIAVRFHDDDLILQYNTLKVVRRLAARDVPYCNSLFNVGLEPTLIEYLANSVRQIRHKAAFIVSKMLFWGDGPDIDGLTSFGCMTLLSRLIATGARDDPTNAILQGMENVFYIHQRRGTLDKIRAELEPTGFFEKLHELCTVEHPGTSARASSLLSIYFTPNGDEAVRAIIQDLQDDLPAEEADDADAEESDDAEVPNPE